MFYSRCYILITEILQKQTKNDNKTYWFTGVNRRKMLFELFNSPVKSTFYRLITDLLVRCFYNKCYWCQVLHC